MATKKKPPRIRARERGSTNSMLESVARPFLDAHPDKEVRWVLSPEHSKELSQIYKRQAQGYELVDPTTEDIVYPHGVSGSNVRVGDLVLMAIDKDYRAEDEEQATKVAQREANKSRDSYLEAMRGVKAGVHKGVGTMGDIKVSTEEIPLERPEE
ncbi:MAG: hypothetical protein ACWGQW_23825 [bacterium]